MKVPLNTSRHRVIVGPEMCYGKVRLEERLNLLLRDVFTVLAGVKMLLIRRRRVWLLLQKLWQATKEYWELTFDAKNQSSLSCRGNNFVQTKE